MSMKLTAALKQHCVEKFGVAADAADEIFTKTIADKLLSGDLDGVTFAKLTEEKAATAAAAVVGQMIDGRINEVQASLRSEFKAGFTELARTIKETLTPLTPQEKAERTLSAPPPSAAHVQEVVEEAKQGDPFVKAVVANLPGSDGASQVETRNAWKQYDATRKTALCPVLTRLGSPHPRAGQPAQHMGHALNEPSDLDKAVIGAFFKWVLYKRSGGIEIPAALRYTEHDDELVRYALHELPWVGAMDGDGINSGTIVNRTKLSPFHRKALLDDSGSGGLEIVPIIFDEAIILTPVLYGELFPLVDVVNVARRRIEGAAIGNPTVGWGVAEGSAITPFTTTSLVTALDTTVYPVTGAMEIGQDFLDDSPIDVANIIVRNYGFKMLEEFDNVIANGSGSDRPQGVFVAAGTVAVSTDNNTSGPPTVSDYEGLMFGLNKAERNSAGARLTFLGNDTSYRRARAIAVGPADERRVFGMTHMDYMLLGFPYKIQNSIANTKVAFVNWAQYRLYRRVGVSVRVENTGNYLGLRNLNLVVVRARMGGRLMRATAAAVATTAQQS